MPPPRLDRVKNQLNFWLNPIHTGGGGHNAPPYVIVFNNYLTEVFFDPNSSLVFLKTPKAHFKTHFESKTFFTGRVIWVFSLRGQNLKFY